MGDEAHSGSYHGSYGLTHARFSHRHRRHALPLHTCSNTTPPKHSPDQNGQGLPPGGPGSLWIATALGSSAAVSALATTARRRQALTPVWSTCCGHSHPSHAARAGGAACRGSASDEFILPAVPDAARTAVVDRRQLTGKMKSTALEKNTTGSASPRRTIVPSLATASPRQRHAREHVSNVQRGGG